MGAWQWERVVVERKGVMSLEEEGDEVAMRCGERRRAMGLDNGEGQWDSS